MADTRLRQAVQAAVDVEPAMLAAMGHRDFFRLDPGLFFVEQAWHSKAGAALYNQRDKEKAGGSSARPAIRVRRSAGS